MRFTTNTRPSESDRRVLTHSADAMAEQPGGDGGVPEPVGSDELNAWKRGFTPQAEIWNGRLAMIGRFQQIVLVFGHFGQLVGIGRIDMDMAGRARTATAAQRQQLVETIVADRFHHGEAVGDVDFAGFAFTSGHDQFGHCVYPRLQRATGRPYASGCYSGRVLGSWGEDRVGQDLQFFLYRTVLDFPLFRKDIEKVESTLLANSKKSFLEVRNIGL